jgi:preprotein translocase subunit YajC
MLFNLLTEASGNGGNNAGSWIMVGVLFLFLVAFLIYSNYSQKKRQKETIATLNAIKPGNKVKTIGGICGVVVEVCEEDNTIVLETGTEKSGKSYIKFDKQAVYQTDAVAKKPETAEEPKAEETPVAEPAETTEEKTEE